MRHLTEGGTYSKNNILYMNYFSSKNKINKSTNYSQNIYFLFIFLILTKQLTRFISFFDIKLRWVFEMFSSSCRIVRCKRRTSQPWKHGCPSLKQLIRLSCDQSVRILNTLIISEGRAAQASRVHFIITFCSGAFKLPASTSLGFPFLANHHTFLCNWL